MSRAVEMQDLITRWEASGLTQRVFAEQEGVAYSAFQYWRRQLRRPRRVKKLVGERAAPLQLTPVRIIPDAPRAAPSASFELRTPSGLAVSVPVGFDEHELVRLLGALSGC